MSDHYKQWQHLFKARAFTKVKLEEMEKLNMDSRYRDEPFFARQEQIKLLTGLLDQQEHGMENIQKDLLTEDELNETILFALAYDLPKRNNHVE